MLYRVTLSDALRSLALGFLVILAVLGTASAQLGTTNSKYGSNVQPVKAPPQVNPFITYDSGFDYATGGVGLRNQNERSIIISGLPAGSTSVAAFLYWVWLPSGSPPPPLAGMIICRTFPLGPTAGCATLSGTLIAIGGDPCWGSVGAYIYRATVPLSVATGNGNYFVRILPGTGALTDGEDPWDGNVVYPLAEGASLVVVGTGSHTVALYDGIAGLTSIGTPVSYTLLLPVATSGGTVLWDNFGSDGQVGVSRTATLAAQETTMIGGFPIAGPGIGAIDSDSDWNGSAGFPLPQLWDDTGHDITAAAPQGTTSLDVAFTSPGDCWNVVGNVVSE